MQEAENARTALIFEEFFLYEAAVGMRALERRGVLPRTEKRLPLQNRQGNPAYHRRRPVSTRQGRQKQAANR